MEPCFTNNPAINGDETNYTDQVVNIQALLRAWNTSLLATHLLKPDGTVKNDAELLPEKLEKRLALRSALQKNEAMPKPVLGIGMHDGIEIVSNADLVTLLALEHPTCTHIPTHVRKSALKLVTAKIV